MINSSLINMIEFLHVRTIMERLFDLILMVDGRPQRICGFAKGRSTGSHILLYATCKSASLSFIHQVHC